MIRKTLLCLGIFAASPAISKEAPPEPEQRPDFAEAGETAISLLRERLVDPESMRFKWTSGFEWGYLKKPLQRRDHGWIACGELNAKNRMGGYNGFLPIYAFIRDDGGVQTGWTSDFISTCDKDERAPVLPEIEGQNF